MRHAKFYVVYITVTVFLLSLTSCIQDTCKDYVCANGGICVNKACACPSGFYGPLCQVTARDAFLGDWNVQELYLPDSVTNAYPLNVSGNDNSTILLLSNFHDGYDSVVCILTTRYSFQINAGQVLDAGFTLGGGTGTLDTLTGKVMVTYSFVRDSVNGTATATWAR